MSEADETSPLLAEQGDRAAAATESSPLLGNEADHEQSQGQQNGSSSRRKPWTLWSRPHQDDVRKESRLRWPSIIAMLVLAILVVAIMFIGFFVPPAVQEYAEKAAVLEPTDLSIESITPEGVRARVRASVRLDGSRVENPNARRIGKAVTGLMRKLETHETTLRVYLPEYGDVLAGTAVVPPLVVDIVDGHATELDFVTELAAGEAEAFRKIANDWLVGKLERLKVVGKTEISLKSGLVPLGTHDVVESMVLEASKIPSIPEYKISRLDLHDAPVDGTGRKVIEADVSVSVHNDYPLSLDAPPLGFEILVPNCDKSLRYIAVAEAATSLVAIRAKEDVKVDARGVIRNIPESLTRACPHSSSSPLDRLMERYLHGEDAQVFVRGKRLNGSDAPEWITDILESITVPFDFPGRSFDSLIRNFSLTDVDFKLPNPFAGADDPDGEPKISGTAQVLAAIPEELNVDLGVNRLRAFANLTYHGRKMGELNMRKWKKANSTKIRDNDDGEKLLQITSRVDDVPLTITDGDVFSEVMQKMLFGDKDVILDVSASVDVKVATVLGPLTVKKVPAKGKVPVKRPSSLDFPRASFDNLHLQVGEIRILNTSDTGVHMQALVNVTNPTLYTASVPFFSIHIVKHGHILGEATTQAIEVGRGNNTNIPVQATWNPRDWGGEKAGDIARDLLSDYVSGKNTTLTARAHRGSIPSVPLIGDALSKVNFTIPTPRLRVPGERSDMKQRFITDATFHVFSSTASFGLLSPLQYNVIHIEHVNATAYYNHSEPVGQIIHDRPIAVQPGRSETSRLPVQWSPSSVGYQKLREALGGTLKLDAEADVTLRLGNFIEQVHYTGEGIGAKVRF